MDINSLKLKYISVFGDLACLQNYENELNLTLARTPSQMQQPKFMELENVQRNINNLKVEVQNLKQTLVARGINSGEISLLETRAKQEGAVKSSRQIAQLPPTPQNNSMLEHKLLQAIETEKFHDKHIKEVEEWNRQEKERQRLLLEQQQKLLDFQKEIERKKMEDERLLSQQFEEMKKKEELLQIKEKTLSEQEKIKLSQIENELRFIENEKKLLEAQRIQLDPHKQQKQFELELERANILGVSPNQSQPNNMNNQSFPQVPNQMNSFANNLVNPNGSVQYASQGSFMYPNAIQSPSLTPTLIPGQTINPVGGFPNNLSMQMTNPSQVNPNNNNNLSMQFNNHSQINQNTKGAPFNANSPFPNTPVPPVAPNQMNFPTAPGQIPQLNPHLQHQFQSIESNAQNNPYSSQSSLPQTDLEKQLWLEQQKALQSQHSFNLQQMQLNHTRNLQEQEEGLRRQWDSQYSGERNAISQQLPDEILMRMSELELRNWMDQANMSRFYEEFLMRRQKLLEEEMWLKQQDMINKQMALSFKEDDLRSKEMLHQQQKEAEMRAKNRVFSIFVEKTGPDGRKTGEVLKLQVRAGDTVFRVCERIGYDKELFKLQLQLNGMTLEDPDRTLMEFGIPDNAVLVTKLVPSISVDIMNLIPCEDCGKAFDAEVFAAHKCMKGYTQELPSERRVGRGRGSRPTVTTTTTTVVKRSCKYCGGLYPTSIIDSHLANCPKRPVTRVFYYN